MAHGCHSEAKPGCSVAGHSNVASDLTTGGGGGVSVEGMCVSTRMRSPATFLPEPLPPRGFSPSSTRIVRNSLLPRWYAYAVVGASTVIAMSASAQAKRPMTFLDAQNMRQVAAPDLSADGRWLLYTLSVPDWKDARRQSDIFLVSTDRGLPSTRQLTFTKDKSEARPLWSRDGSFFVFASDRDASPRDNAPGGSVAPRAVAAPNLPAAARSRRKPAAVPAISCI